jgi:hypothetical protein
MQTSIASTMSSLQHSNQDPLFAADSEEYDDDDRLLCNRVPVGLVRIDPTEGFDIGHSL